MNGVTYIMIYVEVFEILNTTFGVGLIVKNDIKYTVNQTICTQNGDKFKIRHIQLPTTPNVTDTSCLICDNI